MSKGQAVKVIAVTGGKGGVGKTNVSVNLAVSLAKAGKSVLVMDADLGMGRAYCCGTGQSDPRLR